LLIFLYELIIFCYSLIDFYINQFLGEEGKVTESMKLLQDVEAKKALKIEKEVGIIIVVC